MKDRLTSIFRRNNEVKKEVLNRQNIYPDPARCSQILTDLEKNHFLIEDGPEEGITALVSMRQAIRRHIAGAPLGIGAEKTLLFKRKDRDEDKIHDFTVDFSDETDTQIFGIIHRQFENLFLIEADHDRIRHFLDDIVKLK